MQIPFISGSAVDSDATLREALPVNMIPIPGQGSTNDGYLRPAEGVIPFGPGGPGVDRGGIVWNGLHYRVSGTALITVDALGAVVNLGTIGGTGPVRLDYSFDNLGILANGLLYFWNGTVLTTVTDVNVPPNLIDMVWVDSYWMVTDGTIAAVSTLGAESTFNPLQFTGSINPDTMECLLKANGQVQVCSKNQIYQLQNVGGASSQFPFSYVLSSLVTKGVVATRAACVFQGNIGGVIVGTVAFVGSGRDEGLSVYLGLNAQAIRIATAEIDELLLSYTDAQLATIVLEPIIYRGGQFLHVRLPDRTLVYDAIASAAAQSPTWHVRVTALDGFAQCRASFATLAYGSWIVGDPQSGAIGKISVSDSSHWGMVNRWELATPLIESEGGSSNISQMELKTLNGTVTAGIDPTVSLSYSEDGRTWSVDRYVKSGKLGQRNVRLVWFDLGEWRNFRIYRIRGDSNSRLSARKLLAELQPLAY